MEALFAPQLRAFGEVTGRPLAGTSGRRHLGGRALGLAVDAQVKGLPHAQVAAHVAAVRELWQHIK